jgi:signal transduction histidine kinase
VTASRAPGIRDALGEYAAARTGALGIAELDADAVIVAANEALERLAGRPLAGTRAEELFVAAQRPAFARALAETGEAWLERTLGLAADERGILIDFAVSLRRLPHGWLLVAEPAEMTIREVNERLLGLNDELARAQRQIHRQNAELSRQNDALRELDGLKDSLLASVSHDLRTPLTAILGYAELMRRRGGLGERHERSAAVIERNARRLLRLVDDLLLLAQARAGTLRLDVQPVDLGEVAGDAHELARPLAAQAEVALDLDVPSHGVAMIDGDRLRLGQLLDNLVANAIKFTPAGGHVAVRVVATDGVRRLAVSDTGPGIPEPEQARLYEPFARAASPAVPGAGLGLAIVREVADAHGARLVVESEPDRGTCFTVVFAAAHER